jgi:hypothetical protein
LERSVPRRYSLLYIPAHSMSLTLQMLEDGTVLAFLSRQLTIVYFKCNHRFQIHAYVRTYVRNTYASSSEMSRRSMAVVYPMTM